MKQILLFIWAYAQAHQVEVYWLVSNAIFTMPTPRPDQAWYGWLFNILHAIPNVARTINNVKQNRAANNGNDKADAAGSGK